MVTVVGGVVSVVFIVWLYYKSKTRRLIMNFIGKATEIITMYNMILEHMEDEVDELLWQGDFYSILIYKDDYENFIKKVREYIDDVKETYKKIPKRSFYYRTNIYYLDTHLYNIICDAKDEIDKLANEIETEI